MYYDARENKHGLAHDPFKAIVAPRPIGWIGSQCNDGVFNLAPYSFFNAVSDRPHYIMFSSASFKDSVRNIHENGEFTCSLSNWDTRFGMNTSSAPVSAETDEFEISDLPTAPSQFIKPPRVKDAPAALECKHWKTVEMPDVDPQTGRGHYVVFGEVVGVYINDEFIKDGMVDTGAMQPIGRMGYMQYSVVRRETVFDLNRPEVGADGQVVAAQAGAWDGKYR
ncbi:MAG: flavin reductase family protein [Chromatiales bacterium]|nr:flavin reductase family protein [Chromatiales bacterium]